MIGMLTAKDFIKSNEDFQSSVNIAFDLHNEQKIKSLIPTSTVCHYVEEILKDVISKSNQRAKMLVGAYGKGKSHITLTALSAMTTKDPALYMSLIDALVLKESSFADSFKAFVTDGPRLLPVVISGSSTDLSRSFLYALRESLTDINMTSLMPQTNYDGALKIVKRWEQSYPDTYKSLELALGLSGSIIQDGLRAYDTSIYDSFVSAYPSLTSGGTFDSLVDSDVIKTYEHVLHGLKSAGYSGIYVVYDEFSKYLESSIATASIGDVKLLQDFAEQCNRSSQSEQLHLLLISHKNLSNYIDSNLPKEKVDGWRGISGRFVELEIFDNSNQAYELIGSAIGKDGDEWAKYRDNHLVFFDSIEKRYISSGLMSEIDSKAIVEGCFPLHPITTFLLPRVSEIVAQNERTLFTFLSANETNSLPQRAAIGSLDCRYVTPDFIYDYFEPQLRREYYSSSAHQLYILAKEALSRVSESALEARIIKTIAMVYLVAQFNNCPPTKDALLDLYVDAGYSREDILAAFENLIESESIVYLKRSNSYVRLKECSGEKVDEKVYNAAEKLKANNSLIQILNDYQTGRAMYPARHNTEKKITRYFECVFASCDEVCLKLEQGESFSCSGDGVIVAVVGDADNMARAENCIRKHGESYKTTVFVTLKNPAVIDDVAYRYSAAISLMSRASDDSVLRDEYNIIVEDYSEILSSYVADYFMPERRKARYFFPGVCYENVSHRKNLSACLSDLCDAVYSQTPVINNEAINKDLPTGVALKSRSKVLMALCAKSIEPNLGFIGSGQETSIARSVLSVTGLITDLSLAPKIDLSYDNVAVGPMIKEIDTFLSGSNGENFGVLYDRLTLPEFHIGAKRGPIPILIALVLRAHLDSVCIVRDGEECTIDKSTIEDIDVDPAKYVVTQVDWNDEMAGYVSAIGKIFRRDEDVFQKAKVVDDIRAWFVSLPQFTRLSRIDHASADNTPINKTRTKFFKAVNKPVLNPNEFLFETLPSVFGEDEPNMAVVEKLEREVVACDSYIDSSMHVLAERIKVAIKPDSPCEESLRYVLEDWAADNAESLSKHVFAGSGNKIMDAITHFGANEFRSMAVLCRACVSLRLEDWDDRLYGKFFEVMDEFIDEVRRASEVEEEGTIAGQSIEFITDDGKSQMRTFETVECSPRARLLKNQIINAIDEMGQSISKEEKRQIVFDVLKDMC